MTDTLDTIIQDPNKCHDLYQAIQRLNAYGAKRGRSQIGGEWYEIILGKPLEVRKIDM